MAMAIVMGWDNRVWDISTFYLHADRSKCLRLPLRLPKGLRILDEFGNELLACLWSVLYGSPSAGFAAQQTLLAWMLEEFNKDGWFAKHSEVDPAISFIFKPRVAATENTTTRNSGGGNGTESTCRFANYDIAVVITYVDDVDAYGPNVDMLDEIKDR
jgi:hypothetical protein